MLCHEMGWLKKQLLERDTKNHAQARSIRSPVISECPQNCFCMVILYYIYYSYWLSVGITLTGANAKDHICMRTTHSVFFSVWTYCPYIDTLDGPGHNWKVRNIIYHLFESAKFSGNERKCPFLFTIALETLWMTVHAANTETPSKLPITCSKVLLV